MRPPFIARFPRLTDPLDPSAAPNTAAPLSVLGKVVAIIAAAGETATNTEVSNERYSNHIRNNNEIQ